MSISRSQFAALNVAELQKKMGEFSELVEAAGAGQNDIVVSELHAEVVAKNDPALLSAFEHVSSRFVRGDGSLHPPRGQGVIPHQSIKSAMQLMIDSKKAFEKIDENGDGSLDRQEVLKSRANSRFDEPASLAQRAIYGSNLSAEDELRKLLSSNLDVRFEMNNRRESLRSLSAQAGLVATSPAGEKAIAAHLKLFLVSEKLGSLQDTTASMGHVLNKAERWFFRRLFCETKLDDAEVAKMVGSPQLDAYPAKVDRQIRENHGASFEELWLDGTDLDVEAKEGFRFSQAN